MSSHKDIVQFSKFLSLVLRHKPETIGIELDENGWTNVDELIIKLNAANQKNRFWYTVVVRLDLDHIVKTNDKNRFAYNYDRTQIRASQGHSVDVDLALESIEPPVSVFENF